jgi:NadR type nicotinamide-nucleotide adenylyltransferase
VWPENYLVGITGPESTGKTTLATQLARATHGVWIPEFARVYLESKPHPEYSYYDFLAMARGQMQQQILIQTMRKGLIFFDTDHTVIKIWGQEKYGQFPHFLHELYEKCRCDLHLLCYPDIPWEPDPLRESPLKRLYLFEKYEKLLQKEGKPYAVITGSGPARLGRAISLLQISGKVCGA